MRCRGTCSKLAMLKQWVGLLLQLVEPTYQYTLSPTGEFLCSQGNSFVYLTPEKNFYCKLPPKYKRNTCATIGTKLSVANDKKCVRGSSGRGGKGNRPQVLENGYLATKLTIIIFIMIRLFW